ncbi:MAG: C39 family peptidase [Planctomycetaceae bacterium]
MTDLYIGLALIGLLSVATFAVSMRLANGHRWVGNGLAIVGVLLTLFYVRFVWDDIRLARLLPVSNLIIVGNALPLAAGFLAGVLWKRINHWRRIFGVAALAAVGGYAAVFPLLGPVPSCRETWTKNGICLQTTPATCTPACAATLLKFHGIDVTEAEMADLCLTRARGTNWAGLYHALKRKTEGTSLDVKVLYGSAAKLLGHLPGPVILSVGLPDDAAADSYYRTRWIWNPGEEHSILLQGYTDKGMLQIIDPNPRIVYELWRPRDLSVLWRGQGMALIPRRVTPSPSGWVHGSVRGQTGDDSAAGLR